MLIRPSLTLNDTHASRGAQVSTGVLTLLGSAYVQKTGAVSGGAWLCEIFVTVILIPTAIWLDRLIRRNPQRTLAQILTLHLPRWLSRILMLFFWLMGLIAGTYAAYEFVVFTQSNTLFHTPALQILIFLLLTSLLLAYAGKRGLLRYGGFLFPGALLLIIILQGFALAYVDPSNLSFGILSSDSIREFAACVLRLSILPCLLLPELVSLFSSVPSDTHGIGPLTLSIIISGIIATLALLADELVLSASVAASMDFPTYVRSSCIGIGDFFQHVEILSAFLFQISCICVCSRALDSEFPRAIFSASHGNEKNRSRQIRS